MKLSCLLVLVLLLGAACGDDASDLDATTSGTGDTADDGTTDDTTTDDTTTDDTTTDDTTTDDTTTTGDGDGDTTDDTTTTGDGDTTTGDGDGDAMLTFADDIQPLLVSKCSSCHTGGSSGGLDIAGMDGRDNLVGVPAAGCDDQTRVIAGNALASYLIAKLEGVLPAGCGSRMPAGRAPLSVEEIQLIKDWIDQGAL